MVGKLRRPPGLAALERRAGVREKGSELDGL